MISYEDAKRLAAEYFIQNQNEPLACALESNGYWIFFGGHEDKIEFGGEGIKIRQDNGDVSDFILPDEQNFELLDKAKKINL